MKDMDKFIAQQRLLYPLSDESVLKLTERMEEVFAPKGSFPVYERANPSLTNQTYGSRCMKEIVIRMSGLSKKDWLVRS